LYYIKIKIFLDVYNWILKEKYKSLIEVLDKYEENQEEDPKLIVKKICDIIVLLSNDGMDYILNFKLY